MVIGVNRICIAFLFLALFLSHINLASDSLRKYKFEWEGRPGVKLGLSYNFGKNDLRGEIGIFTSDFWDNRYIHRSDCLIPITQKLIVSSEFNINHGMLIGPKIGYELNYFPFVGRVSLVDYLDLQKSYNIIFRPEIGFTQPLSVWTLTYGYNFLMVKKNELLSYKNVISLGYCFPR